MSLNNKKLHDVYLGLGSNLGDRKENLNRAINHIEERIGNIISTSAFYITDPVGFASDNQFQNAACHVKTQLNPQEVLMITQEIEKEMGRAAKSQNKQYSDRIIDVDILLFDNEIVITDNLILPHSHLHERAFVLLPLAEIAGGYLHPVLHQTIEQLKKHLP